MIELRTIAGGLAFAEGPRWHDGALWWSDMHGGVVQRFVGGAVETVCPVPGRPSGLGWLPDGRLLVVSMIDRRVLRREPDGSLVVHADLAALAPRRCNDMVVDAHGRAYVGNFGFEIDADLGLAEPPTPTVVVRVDPDGAATIVADDLMFPNGTVITPDGGTLIVAETYRACLTAFAVAADGALSNRRCWARLDDSIYPDGICLDAAGAVWVASPSTREVVRVTGGGTVTDRLATGQRAFACALGGDDGRTLFICVADSHDRNRQRTQRNGRIVAFEVAVAGAAIR